mmetsp:Transcript_21716/g.53156  ORF Transcript_21716/g.53156 Transcript_21716/m.53156 type:complete len:231 (+) Transcript_21716:1426-2118(+)
MAAPIRSSGAPIWSASDSRSLRVTMLETSWRPPSSASSASPSAYASPSASTAPPASARTPPSTAPPSHCERSLCRSSRNVVPRISTARCSRFSSACCASLPAPVSSGMGTEASSPLPPLLPLTPCCCHSETGRTSFDARRNRWPSRSEQLQRASGSFNRHRPTNSRIASPNPPPASSCGGSPFTISSHRPQYSVDTYGDRVSTRVKTVRPMAQMSDGKENRRLANRSGLR